MWLDWASKPGGNSEDKGRAKRNASNTNLSPISLVLEFPVTGLPPLLLSNPLKQKVPEARSNIYDDVNN
jgi:hypothetical protein